MALVPLVVAVMGPRSVASNLAGGSRFAVDGSSHPSSSRALVFGLVAGGVYFAGTLYWITDVMVSYGGLNRPLAVVVNGLLVAYLALYPALFAWLLARLKTRLTTSMLVLVPVLWVATEFGRARLFGGFPWVLLGYSQASVLPVAQIASLLGIFGLSGLVALVNGSIACALVGRNRSRAIAVTVGFLCILTTAAWGSWRMRQDRLTHLGTPIRVGLVQGNIAQEDKWDRAKALSIVRRYLDMSRQAASQGARFLIWPESSTPFYFEEDPVGRSMVSELAREVGAYVLVGSDEIERGPETRYFNSAFLLRPDGQTVEVYRKIHLVPFGEYVPFKRLLFFASPLVEAVSDFSAGTAPVILPIEGHRASTAICYEVVYPDLIRQFVTRGSELLTTITNDAWYGRSSAPHQHFEQAAVRAIEQGRYLARSANTGVSGIVDPYGRVLARSGIFEPAAIVGDVRFINERTLYAAIGDLFAYVCVAAAVLAFASVEMARRSGRRAVPIARGAPAVRRRRV